MPIPEFTEHGLLPNGIFPATQLEIEDRYLRNPNRAQIWCGFNAFLIELKDQSWFAYVAGAWLDGGFTSDKPATKDIDVILDLSEADDLALYEASFWLSQEHDRICRDFQVDVYPYHPKMNNDFRLFFAYVKADECLQRNAPADTRKGLLAYKL